MSPRTIERDLSALQQAGVPIYAEPGRRGGYALEKSMSLPPLNFTPAEAVAVAIALSRAEGQPFAAQARSALGKLMAAMPGAEGERARELARQVQILRPERREPHADRAVAASLAAPEGDPAPASEGHATKAARDGVPPVHRADSAPVTRDITAPDAASSAGAAGPLVEVIETALLSRVVVRIRYADRSGAVTSREVEPGAFVGVRNGVWYLAGWCRLRNEARVFRLDRIASAVLTDEPAPRRPIDDFTSHAPDSVILRPALD
ncbi:helix-turn-helix transcriptional regulator [Microtetraspora malaysiensis]|uniref:helix-turn-helix transcriptional regulator n=1 Tax=Microtetraspora malaysiensis TaxID=161358 RepID=UPI003D91EF3E